MEGGVEAGAENRQMLPHPVPLQITGGWRQGWEPLHKMRKNSNCFNNLVAIRRDKDRDAPKRIGGEEFGSLALLAGDMDEVIFGPRLAKKTFDDLLSDARGSISSEVGCHQVSSIRVLLQFFLPELQE